MTAQFPETLSTLPNRASGRARTESGRRVTMGELGNRAGGGSGFAFSTATRQAQSQSRRTTLLYHPLYTFLCLG
jgi:hypothetical protein